MNLSSEITGAIRIGIAALVGWATTQLLLGVAAVNDALDTTLEINVDSSAVVSFLTVIVIDAYYLAARHLEQKYPQLRFLGLTRTVTHEQAPR